MVAHPESDPHWSTGQDLVHLRSLDQAIEKDRQRLLVLVRQFVDLLVQRVEPGIMHPEFYARGGVSPCKLVEMERKYDAQFKVVFDAIRQLIEQPANKTTRIGFRP